MKTSSALLRGTIVLSGLAFAHAGWAQGAMPPTSPAGTVQPDQTTGPAVTLQDLLPQGTIKQITILGNKNISTDAIQGVMTEKVGDKFDAQTAEKDQAAITAMGYWAAPARYADIGDGKGGVDMTFSVVENPIITAIQFNANTPTGEPTIPSATLLAQMQTKPGQVLNMPQLQRDLGGLFALGTGYASRQGYWFEAGSSIHIDPKTGVLTVPVVEAYVQAILITGSHRVSTDEILKSISTKPGDVYNAQAVQKDVAQLVGTSRLKAVGPAQVEQTVPSRVVLTIPVTEKD